MTYRQVRLYLDVIGERLHTDRRERWNLVRFIVASTSGAELEDFPDYAASEEDTEALETALDANPLVIHVKVAE